MCRPISGEPPASWCWTRVRRIALRTGFLALGTTAVGCGSSGAEAADSLRNLDGLRDAGGTAFDVAPRATGALADAASAPCLDGSEQSQRWASEVLLGVPRGGGPTVVRRFTAPFAVSMMAGDTTTRALLREIVRSWNRALGGSEISAREAGDGDDSAQILVWFTPSERFETIASEYNFVRYPDNLAQFYLRWNPDNELTRSYVLIGSELMQSERFVHFAYEGVTRALGVGAQSAVFTESLFFGNGDRGGNARRLSCQDERLLDLLYAYLSPGDTVDDVTMAVERYW